MILKQRFKSVRVDFVEKQLISVLKQGKYQMSLRLVGPENREVFEKERNLPRGHRADIKELPMVRTGITGSTKLIDSNPLMRRVSM